MIAFVLSMPGRNSWNGRWSGEGNLYAIVKRFTKKGREDELNGQTWYHRWNDGWTAKIEAKKVDAKEAAQIRRKSRGFCGYDWMVSNIILYGETEAPKREQVT